MTIRVVFFDAGGTLIYPDPPVGEVYAAALRKVGGEADAQEVQRRFEEAFCMLRQQRRAGGPAYGSSDAEARRWWKRAVREALRPYGPVPCFEGLFDGLWRHFASGAAWRLFDDVRSVIDGLRGRGLDIGMISNWDSRLGPVLEALGLDAALDYVVISCRVGAEKPAPAIFARALELSGVGPHEAMHVGDSWQEDALGAARVGMHGVWLNRESCELGTGAPTVHSLRELPALLDQL